jgi:HK97 family phage prohead protease
MKKILFGDTEKRSFNVKIERRAEDDSRTVGMTAAVFNLLSKPLGWGFREKIEPGAFADCDMSDVVAIWNHNMDIIFGRTRSKTLRLTVDEAGLQAEFDVPETGAGNDFLISLSRGDVDTASFQFIVDKDRWVMDPDHGEVRIIEKFRKLIDVSPVVFEAYPDTTVAKRSHEDQVKTDNIPLALKYAEAELEIIKIKNH